MAQGNQNTPPVLGSDPEPSAPLQPDPSTPENDVPAADAPNGVTPDASVPGMADNDPDANTSADEDDANTPADEDDADKAADGEEEPDAAADAPEEADADTPADQTDGPEEQPDVSEEVQAFLAGVYELAENLPEDEEAYAAYVEQVKALYEALSEEAKADEAVQELFATLAAVTMSEETVARIGGTDYNTLAAALSAAQSGNIVELLTGEYVLDQPLIVPAGVTLTGPQTSGWTAVSAKIINQGANHLILSDGAKIQYLYISSKNVLSGDPAISGGNWMQNTAVGFAVNSATTIDTCWIEGPSLNHGMGLTALYASPSCSITVQNSTFDNFERGFYTCGDNEPMKALTFENNNFRGVKIPIDGYWGAAAGGPVQLRNNYFEPGYHNAYTVSYIQLWDYSQYLGWARNQPSAQSALSGEVSGNYGAFSLLLPHTDWMARNSLTLGTNENANVSRPQLVEITPPNGKTITSATVNYSAEFEAYPQARTVAGKWCFYRLPAGTYTAQIVYADGTSESVDFKVSEPAGAALGSTQQVNLNHVAADQAGNTYATVQEALAAEGTTAVTLLKDVTECITIESGKNVTLDLNGKTLTNVDGVKKHTITVNAGGTLTVNGPGEVDNVSHQASAVLNYGTVYLNSGTFNRSKENGNTNENSGGNSFYTISNRGTMVIGDGVNDAADLKVMQNGIYSSLVDNGTQNQHATVDTAIAEMTINGGYFDHGKITLKNEAYGHMVINDGIFIGNNWIVCNYGVAEIKGGEFNGENALSGIVYNGVDTLNEEKGTWTVSGRKDTELKITGGRFTFNGTNPDPEVLHYIIRDYVSKGTWITGGSYSVSNFYWDVTGGKGLTYSVIPYSFNRFK